MKISIELPPATVEAIQNYIDKSVNVEYIDGEKLVTPIYHSIADFLEEALNSILGPRLAAYQPVQLRETMEQIDRLKQEIREKTRVRVTVAPEPIDGANKKADME